MGGTKHIVKRTMRSLGVGGLCVASILDIGKCAKSRYSEYGVQDVLTLVTVVDVFIIFIPPPFLGQS